MQFPQDIIMEAIMADNKNKNNKRKKISIILAIAFTLILFTMLSAVVSFALIYKDAIRSGIFVEDIDIGGLSVIEANNRIEGNFKNLLDNDKLILNYNDYGWKFNSKDLGLKYDFLRAVNDAYLIGRRGTYLDRFETMIDLLRRPYSVSLKSSVNSQKINELLESLEMEVNRPSLEAKIFRENNDFIVTKETLGIRLNKEETAAKITEELLNSSFYDVIIIDLVVEDIVPKHTYEKLSQIKELLGSYTTTFNSKLKGRSYNVSISAKSIDGMVLLPGEVFSFNNTVGPRTIENGYKVAPVILRGELVDGIGGGICQVSSTLYNSVLISQLGIIERTNHSIPSTYVPLGLDATVVYGALDFKFQNTLDIPIYIETVIKGNKITVNIYGKKETDRKVKLTSHIDKVVKKDTEIIFDNNMFEGDKLVEEKGRDGYRVSTYMTIYEGNRVVEKKLVSKDYYRPRKEVVKKGTKQPIQEEKTAENEGVLN